MKRYLLVLLLFVLLGCNGERFSCSQVCIADGVAESAAECSDGLLREPKCKAPKSIRRPKVGSSSLSLPMVRRGNLSFCLSLRSRSLWRDLLMRGSWGRASGAIRMPLFWGSYSPTMTSRLIARSWWWKMNNLGPRFVALLALLALLFVVSAAGCFVWNLLF